MRPLPRLVVRSTQARRRPLPVRITNNLSQPRFPRQTGQPLVPHFCLGVLSPLLHLRAPIPPPGPTTNEGAAAGSPPHTHTQHTPPRPRASGPSGRGGSAGLVPGTPSPRRGSEACQGLERFRGSSFRKGGGERLLEVSGVEFPGGGGVLDPEDSKPPTTTTHLRGALPLAFPTPFPRYHWDGGPGPRLP